ncbi:MAG: hypothetical protein SFZ23_16315 [Planctomycetota bacterium]|nr:hypothetical protein [Planctomycetota bacterium]
MQSVRKLRVALVAFTCGVSALHAAAIADGVVPDPRQDELPAATQNLLQTFPGLRVERFNDRIVALAGKPMTTGQTPAQAAENFWLQHGSAFGVNNPQLEITRASETGSGKFTVFHYKQYVDGLPVDFGMARVLVLNGQQPKVVYAGAKLAKVPAGGFAPIAVDGAVARGTVQNMPAYGMLTEWSEPELVVYYGEGDGDAWITPVRAWAFEGWGSVMDANGLRPFAFRFFVDASNGQLVFARNNIHHDVDGTVRGWGSPGTRPDLPANAEVLVPMPRINVTAPGTSGDFTDAAGNFSIAYNQTANLILTTGPGDGEFLDLFETGGVAITTSVTTPNNTFVELTLNELRDQTGTAQVNASVHANITRDYARARIPNFNPANIRINTSVAGSCNAFYTTSGGFSINFYREGGGCVNSAYSTVVAHEFGHHIVNQLGLAQGAFGEGYSDSVAILIYDTGIIAENFFLSGGTPIRNPETANQQYPCTVAIHTCGQVVGGFWREFRNLTVARLGAGPGLELARQLHGEWSDITLGGQGTNAMHPTSVTEVLTVDDVDGDLGNGTPNFADICNAFAQHGLSCPSLDLLTFAFPNGLPERVTPGQPAQIRFDVVGAAGTPAPNSGQIFYRVNGGSFQSAPAQQTAANQYLATIPGQACQSRIDFYFSAQAQGGATEFDPSNAPTTSYTTTALVSSEVTLEDDAEQDRGWSLAATGDTATTGRWVRGNPNGTPAQPEDDRTPGTGVNCFFTGQGTVGGAVGEQDVDNGTTTLTTPVLDATGGDGAILSYWRWYSNTAGGAPNEDSMVVDVSNDNGSTWTRLETVGPNTQNTGGWIFATFNLGTVLPLTNQMRVRFIASDLGSGSIVEAAIDDLRLESFDCTDCAADFNNDGTADFFDYLDFANAYGNQDASADFNDDGTVDFFDYLDFVAAFDAGC